MERGLDYGWRKSLWLTLVLGICALNVETAKDGGDKWTRLLVSGASEFTVHSLPITLIDHKVCFQFETVLYNQQGVPPSGTSVRIMLWRVERR